MPTVGSPAPLSVLVPELPLAPLVPALPLVLEPLPEEASDLGDEPFGGVTGVAGAPGVGAEWPPVRPVSRRRREAWATLRSVLVSSSLAIFTARRSARQLLRCLRRQARSAFLLDASVWSAAAWAVTALRRATLLATATGCAEEPAEAAAMDVSPAEHAATRDIASACVHARRGP